MTLAGISVPLLAQTTGSTGAGDTSDIPLIGQFDIGFRGTRFGDAADEARFQRYRDLSDGITLDRFAYAREKDVWQFRFGADRVGYRDQHYMASFNRYGRVKASFDWNQVPLFYSRDTASIFATGDAASAGTLRISNQAIRSGIQNGTLRVADVAPLLGSSFDLRQRRDVAAASAVVAVARDVDAKLTLTSTHKEGEMPWGTTFGFSAANEVAAPIDHRTTDVGAALEWATSRGMARVGYDGSWFDNRIPTLSYESPFRLTDSPTLGSALGRSDLWPDSMANTVSAAAAYNLPARSRVNGSLSIGQWSQNETLLPFTANTALAPIPLDRPTAEAEARITSFNVNASSRPTDRVWLNVRARRYDYDNRTPIFRVTNYVRFDQTVQASLTGGTEPFSFTRDFVDVDASFTALPFTALKVGYGFEQDDRTFRLFETTKEHTVRTALDTTGTQYATFRLAYEHSTRTGSGLDEEVFDEIGEQLSLRQFDISNRNRDRITALAQVTPMNAITLFASVQTGRDERPDAAFGLRKLDTNNVSVGFDAAPIDTLGLGLTYGYDDAATSQNSRQANPGVQFNDPTRDWATDVSEKVHYVVANVDLLKAIPKTDVKFAFDWNRSNADYTYVLPVNSTLPAVGQLPRVVNELRRASVDLRHFVTRHVAVGFVYFYDSYDVSDFQLSPEFASGARTLADGILLGYYFRPYSANTGWVRLTYLW